MQELQTCIKSKRIFSGIYKSEKVWNLIIRKKIPKSSSWERSRYSSPQVSLSIFSLTKYFSQCQTCYQHEAIYFHYQLIINFTKLMQTMWASANYFYCSCSILSTLWKWLQSFPTCFIVFFLYTLCAVRSI